VVKKDTGLTPYPPAGGLLPLLVFFATILSGCHIQRPLTAASGSESDPQIFAPGVISTRDFERDGTFTPDETTFFFTKRAMWPYFSAICVSHFTKGKWTEPEVASFSGQYYDAAPFVSPDGRRLYFASRRPGDAGSAQKRDFDLWYVDIMPSGLGAPVHL